ncbi:MAG: hypothetical protein M3Y25_01810 [Thermoproteota archaeon]|nr:hypothetical protein [Thermoproteota archaeon]
MIQYSAMKMIFWNIKITQNFEGKDCAGNSSYDKDFIQLNLNQIPQNSNNKPKIECPFTPYPTLRDGYIVAIIL